MIGYGLQWTNHANVKHYEVNFSKTNEEKNTKDGHFIFCFVWHDMYHAISNTSNLHCVKKEKKVIKKMTEGV